MKGVMNLRDSTKRLGQRRGRLIRVEGCVLDDGCEDK